MRNAIFILLLSLCCLTQLIAQEKKVNEKERLIQFSGVVVGSDSLGSIPYASIMIKNSYRGTISDFYGYFSLVAKASDTIVFNSIGYQATEYVIPDTLTSNRYSMIQMLRRDTVELKEVEVFPWPTKEQFKQAFLNAQLPDDDMARAMKNLDPKTMSMLSNNLPMGSTGNSRYTMNNFQTRLYQSGSFPSYNILNPMAWAKFIQAWKNGDFNQNR